MKAVRISVCLFLVAILTIMLDIGYDIVLSNECIKTLKRQIMLDTYYCNSMQEEYFSQDNFRMGNLVELSVPGSSAFYCQSPYATPAYSDFINELSASGDSYLTLCAGILKDASGVPNPNYKLCPSNEIKDMAKGNRIQVDNITGLDRFKRVADIIEALKRIKMFVNK